MNGGLLLINPNTSGASLAMMLDVARRALPTDVTINGVHAATGPSMIINAAQLAGQVSEVVRLGVAACAQAIIVAAFGDPGVAELRRLVAVPVIGIGEASVREAAAGGRRFAIATTTPGLMEAMSGMVERLGFSASFTGVRLAAGDPLLLAADPAAQEQALGEAVSACISDGAETVIIGGGPLSAAARSLRQRLDIDIIEPVPAAVRVACREAGYRVNFER